MGETVTTALTTAFTQIKTDVLDGEQQRCRMRLQLAAVLLQSVSAGASSSLLLDKRDGKLNCLSTE